MNKFEYGTRLAQESHKRRVENIKTHLQPSHGKPEIGDPELKFIVMELLFALENQTRLNDILIEKLSETRPPFWKRFFKK